MYNVSLRNCLFHRCMFFRNYQQMHEEKEEEEEEKHDFIRSRVSSVFLLISDIPSNDRIIKLSCPSRKNLAKSHTNRTARTEVQANVCNLIATKSIHQHCHTCCESSNSVSASDNDGPVINLCVVIDIDSHLASHLRSRFKSRHIPSHFLLLRFFFFFLYSRRILSSCFRDIR